MPSLTSAQAPDVGNAEISGNASLRNRKESDLLKIFFQLASADQDAVVMFADRLKMRAEYSRQDKVPSSSGGMIE